MVVAPVERLDDDTVGLPLLPFSVSVVLPDLSVGRELYWSEPVGVETASSTHRLPVLAHTVMRARSIGIACRWGDVTLAVGRGV